MFLTSLLIAVLPPAAPPLAPQEAAEPARVPIRDVLAVGRLGVRRRSAVYTDGLEARIARGEFSAPREGDVITSADGEEHTWTAYSADESGNFSGTPFRGGWAHATVDVPASGAWMLDARGHSVVLVDGAAYYGDVYNAGLTRQPLALTQGAHELLFRCGRGSLQAELVQAPSSVYFESKDRTAPDLMRGPGGVVHVGQIISNATNRTAADLKVEARSEGALELVTELPPLLPSSLHKCAIQVPIARHGEDAERVSVELILSSSTGEVLHRTEFELSLREEHQKHSTTFVSKVDGSVQYYGVTPPSADTPETDVAPALYLTLHGAGVEGRGQSNAYSPKAEGYVVGATNRRPYGFDWEDWGRLDAMEVLELASSRFKTDPARTYLTGHSMGGHGTWQVGAHFAGRFAAIAPSAGWRDFWSYAGGGTFPEDDPIGDLLARSVNASRTALLQQNYAQLGVYILHGDADNNVPVSEARTMRASLAEFHPNFAYYEQPGAGHWWGNHCVDWPPLFDFFRENRIKAPESIRVIDFTTVDPAISSQCHWVTIEAQQAPLQPTRVQARLDTGKRELQLELENVSRISADLSCFLERPSGDAEPLLAGDEPLTIRSGGSELQLELDPGAPRLSLGVDPDGAVQLVGPPQPGSKGWQRGGNFKSAFQNGMIFVYGTGGTDEQAAWALAKARYDLSTWRYRGNGTALVLSDSRFLESELEDRNVILYGNQDTNRAWSELLGDAPFELRNGRVRLGDRELEGNDLALLAIHPRRGSETASVAVIGGTGMAGCRTTDHLPYWVSGVAYPDWTIFGADFLTEGLAGIRGAGYFSNDWSALEGAEGAWRE